MISISHHRKLILAIALVGLFGGALLWLPQQIKSGALTSARDTLSNSRLSYDASVSANTSSGATTLAIDTESVDDNTTHLFPGDVICVQNAAETGCKGNVTYTVGSIISSTEFTITTPLTTNILDEDSFVATQSATHTVVFTTSSGVTNGSIVIYIPASGTTAASNNGFADSGSDASGTQGFDLNGLAAGNVSCSGTGPSSWDAETITSSVTSGSGEHEIIFPFTGTLNASTTVTCTLGGAILINPAPASDHTQGTADDLQITISEYNHNTPSSGDLIDTVDVAVAPIEAVFVSATVDETLSFSINLVNTGATACGINPDITSTYNSVPFGTLSLNTFATIAHDLDVSTNASGGYSVTATATDQMGKDGVTCTGDGDEGDNCIPDTVCDGSSCDETAANVDDWETATNNGFGYSLDSSDGTDAAWEWDGTDGTCDGAGTDFCAAQFADEEDSESPVSIMSNAGPVDSSNVYVCYRISVGATQPAGYYYNNVRYTATPTF